MGEWKKFAAGDALGTTVEFNSPERRYTNWYQVGYMSSTGTCFDIGGAMRNALERFSRTGETFEGGALLAANLGDDADATGAVYGQNAGAFYGRSGIPAHWRKKLAMQETFEVSNEAM